MSPVSAGTRVILASAGTGKTYQLSGAYLGLLLRDVPPERILASSFTRKAAGEILDRVLTRLAEACESDTARAELAQQLRIPLDRDALRARLARLLRELQGLQIGTLDAFFARCARAFGAELGLPPEWRLGDEVQEKALQAEILGRVIARADRDELLVLLRSLQRKGDAGRAVMRVLQASLDQAGRLDEQARPGAWEAVQPPPRPPEAALEAAVESIRRLQLPLTQKGQPVATWSKNRDRILEALAGRDWEQLLSTGVVKAAVEGKEQFDRKAIDAGWRAALLVLAAEAAHHLGQRLVDSNHATARLLERCREEARHVRHERRMLTFSHLPRALAPAGGAGAIPPDELAYRLDGRTDHLLLDEFQDTSPEQWRVLRPMAEELAADGTGARSFFCVGDPKQSIYGWRSAEPRLLTTLAASLHVEPERLSKSYRSAPVVLQTVQRIFATLSQSPVFEGREEERDVAAEFQRQFQEPVAHRKGQPGDALLRQVRVLKGESTLRPLLVAAADRARELHAAAPHATIALLLRRKQPMGELLYELERRGLHASGEGGNPLTDSAAVNVALAALQLSLHPGDSMAMFHVEHSALGAELELRGQRGRAPAVARLLRRRLCEDGLAQLLGGLAVTLAPTFGDWDMRRFARLVDMAVAHEASGATLEEFLTRARTQRVEDPSAARIQVMTIHAAKGLEFDAVLLPELCCPWLGRSPAVICGRDGEDPMEPFSSLSHNPNENLRTLMPELARLHAQTRARELVDELACLYVALTRAKSHLELFIPRRCNEDGTPRAREKLPFSAAGVVEACFATEELAGDDGILWSHEDGSFEWTRTAAPVEASEPPRAPKVTLAAPGRSRELTRASPSGLEQRRTGLVARLLEPRHRARERGVILHAWYERVGWLEEFRESDADLLAHARARGLEPDAELLAFFRATLAEGELRAHLSRGETARRLGAAQGELVLLREQRFAQISPDGESLLTGAFDRAVLVHRGGRAVAAELLDYKSDRAADEAALQARIEQHRPQLEAYRAVLERSHALPSGAVRACLAFVAVGRVVALGTE